MTNAAGVGSARVGAGAGGGAGAGAGGGAGGSVSHARLAQAVGTFAEQQQALMQRTARAAVEAALLNQRGAAAGGTLTALAIGLGTPGVPLAAAAGPVASLQLPFPTEVIAVALLGGPVAGSCVVDLQVALPDGLPTDPPPTDVERATAALAAYAAGSYSSICGSARPSLTASRGKLQDDLGVYTLRLLPAWAILVVFLQSVSVFETLTVEPILRRV